MNNINIRKATLADENSVVDLLEGFYPGIPEHWRKLFKPRWKNISNDYPGLILEVNQKIVGFIGLIFSEVDIKLKGRFTLCNLTTWYVHPDFRQHGLLLIINALKIPNVSWTNFTSSPKPYTLLKRLGFVTYQDKQTLIFPLPRRSKQKVNVLINPRKEQLPKNVVEIYENHKDLACMHVLIQNDHEKCYCLVVKTYNKKLPLAKFYYVSNPILLSNVIFKITFQLCWKLKVAYLLMEGDLLNGSKKWGVRSVTMNPPRLYKSDTLTREDITLLASEVFVLGI